ncbi:amidase-like protein 2 [Elsinoe australis]|uniref:Glutamyl-tRNA(Gln) amidotransferase subunit A, mitochondrial n=1 Tax=Elsinoe australis TaxID=40998 RepID=A0A4U7B900_9PEZI|nr:amidase-like protein 2 [Elsinoe australis]
MSSLKHVEHCISRQLAHKKLNAFVSLPEAEALRSAAQRVGSYAKQGPLSGRLISLKDNIASPASCKEPTTCASLALRGYVSPYPSTVSTLLERAGAIVAGKTNMDEFGMGSHSQSARSGAVRNHLRKSATSEALSAGGSSGGSAVAVATGQCWAALGTDTGGSVRLPAAWTGTVGFKPSYGRLSRWGVVDYANSLDAVGLITSTVSDATGIYQALNKYDSRDPTSLPESTRSKLKSVAGLGEAARSHLRIGVPSEYNVQGMEPEVKTAWIRALEKLQERGHELVQISLPSTSLALSAYYVLAPAEASSNLARYDGIRYGHRSAGADAVTSTKPHAEDEQAVLFAKTRGAAFGPEVQRRILLGTYTLSSSAYDNYFLQAQRVRRLVQHEFSGAFAAPNALVDARESKVNKHPHADGASDQAARNGGVDVIIVPTAPTLPPTLSEVSKQSAVEKYIGDVFTVPASLAGLPALNVPVPIGGKQRGLQDEFREVEEEVSTVGMQVIGQFGQDEMVLGVGKLVERIFQGGTGDAAEDVERIIAKE